MTSLRTLLSLALGALLAAPLSAGAAVTATTVSQPVTDPSVLVFVEPTGVPLTVSGTSNGGTGRLDLRCEGAATPVVDANVRPAASGVWTTTTVPGGRQRAERSHVLPARGAPRQRRHQPRRVRRQARDVPALARDRRRRRSEQRRPLRLPLLGAAAARPVDLAVDLHLRARGRLDDRADHVPHLRRRPSRAPDSSLPRPPGAPACSSITPTPTCRLRRPRSSTALPTPSACSRRRRRSRPIRARATS